MPEFRAPLMVRVPARALRRVVTAMARPWRRRAARRAAQASGATSILVICQGNICRSPFAAAALQRVAPALAVASAGLMWPGRPAPDDAVLAAARRGIDLSSHRSRLATPDVLRGAQLVVVMDAGQRDAVHRLVPGRHKPALLLGDFDPRAGRPRAILDPVDQPPAVFDACYARIESCVGELAAALEASSDDTSGLST